MLGAIIGDVIGSVHEWARTKSKDFPLLTECSTFTDDSVLTIAVADWILTGHDLVDLLHDYTHAYPGRGYGGRYGHWAMRRLREPYNSFGNGAAMRVSPVGFAFATMEEVLDWSKRSAEVTHNHPEGICGAQATAVAIYLAPFWNPPVTKTPYAMPFRSVATPTHWRVSRVASRKPTTAPPPRA